jgi:hypothetical protein
MNDRRPFRDRENILSCDVSEAIRRLVGSEDGSVTGPVALDRQSIAEELIILAHMQEDGTVAEIAPIVHRTMVQQFTERLSTTSVFASGYKQFADEVRLPVVPVTTYFFERVYTEAVRDCLDAMDENEVRQSLPRRESRVRDPATNSYLRDHDDEFIVSGSIAGIVIFPPHTKAPLLTYWLHRRSRSATGSLNSTVAAIKNARPETPAVERLDNYVRGVGPSIAKALPRIEKDSGS